MSNYNVQLIKVLVPGVSGGNTSRRFNFDDKAYLRDAFIYGIETYCANDISVNAEGITVISATVLKNSFLTLYLTDPDKIKGEGEYIYQVPLVDLHTIQNANNDPFVRIPFDMVGQVISWDKCYITLGAGVGNTVDNCFLFKINFRFNKNSLTN